MHALAILFAILALAGAAYPVITLLGAWKFRLRSRDEDTTFTPPVSILKPFRGVDREIYEAFRSHCVQDYPEFEIIFGVSDPNDPAVAEVERLKREFPQHAIRLVVCPQILGNNRKVSSLAQMLPHAKHDFILVNDSDIRVAPDYLRRVMGPFADERVGMVTTLYRAHAGETIASRLESLMVNDFCGGVLSSRLLEGGIRFGLGATLALRRSALEAIGGFTPLLNHLADDYELGVRIVAQGHRVELADTVVDTHLPDYDFAPMFEHQLRWARTVRDARPSGYFGFLFSYSLPWAILCALCALGTPWSLALLAVVATLRIASATVIAKTVLHDTRVLRDFWLIPLRDFVGLLTWFWSYGGHEIVWRGETFRLKKGILTRI